jgi:hypothetical protein
MGFLAVAGICFISFVVGAMITQRGDDDDDFGGGKMIPALNNN